MRIDQADPSTYGAYAARQFIAIAAADAQYREGMTKRPSASSIKITYLDAAGERKGIHVREIFCRMEGDALVLTQFENSEGQIVKDLPIASPAIHEAEDDEDDDSARLHELAMAELGEEPLPPAEVEPEPEVPRSAPERGKRLPSGPLRQYEDSPASSPSGGPPAATPGPAPSARATPQGPAVPPPVASATRPSPVASATRPPAGAPAGLAVRALDDGEAAALRALIEAKAGQARWASGILIQAAERHPSERRLQNEHLANLLRLSLDPSRPESGTPLAAAMRSVIEEVLAHKTGLLDRDPLKAEKAALQPFARAVLAPAGSDDGPPKTVTGTAQRTPAQVLAKLDDPMLARATRVKLLLEIVPELIESWKPDKESGRSEAGNESSPAIVRKLFAVANEQRQQRKFLDDGAAFKKARERYAGLEGKLPKASADE